MAPGEVDVERARLSVEHPQRLGAAHAARQVAGVGGAQQLVQVRGGGAALHQVIVGARHERGHRRLLVAGAGDDHHRQRQLAFADLRQQLQAAAVGELQVGQHKVEGGLRPGQALPGGGQGRHDLQLQLRGLPLQLAPGEIGVHRVILQVEHAQ